MAIKDLLSFFDPALEAIFHRKEASPEQLRAPLLKGIEQAQKQFENGSTKAPNRWWKASNGVVALTVKVKGDTLDINGVATNHMPEERFAEFLGKMRTAVEAGEFDDELRNKGNGDAEVHIPKAKAKGTRNFSTASTLGIKVGGHRRGEKAKEYPAIKKLLLEEGYEAADIDAAIAKKKEVEKAAKAKG